MLVGGAIGNLIDRLSHDGVTDFIAVTSHWPPFNVADIGIVCGAIIAGIGLMGERTD
jgi:signal peptidase II